MASSDKSTEQSRRVSRRGPTGGGGAGWISSLLGGREIEKRVDENFPSWEDYSGHKISEGRAREAEDLRVDLPPHRIYVSSPLHGNFLFVLMVALALVLGIYTPQLGPVLVYGAIALVLMTSLFVVFRDALFFHIEGQRLEQDAEMINKHNRGPKTEFDEKAMGFMQPFTRKHRKSKIFRSRLLQIHYQNVLRTFEQGNRRTWVDQDASIADLHTLLSQRGMKLVWTMIEVLPQLGLLGTLIGLMRMFTAFRADVTNPEVAILAGFGTALGTTVVANIMVLVLRPLYMRNERSMYEVLSTIQTLMATFILPTQETVLERTVMAGFGKAGFPLSNAQTPYTPPPSEAGLKESLTDLSKSLNHFTEVQQQVDSGAMAKQTAEIAEEVRETLKAFTEAVDRDQLETQQRAILQLTEAIQGLAGNLNRQRPASGKGGAQVTERMEHDLTQLRVLTHDTLLLLEQIADRLGPPNARGGRLLSKDSKLRSQVFPDQSADRGGDAPSGEDSGPVRLFKGPVGG